MAKSRDPLGKAIGPILWRREMVAFVPAVGLAWLWFGLGVMMLVGVTALAVAWMTRPLSAPDFENQPPRDGVTGLPLRAEGETILEGLLIEAENTAQSTACLVVGVDGAEGLAHQLSPTEFDEVLGKISERLVDSLRHKDRVVRLEGAKFAVMLKPTPRPDLESMIQLSGRLQSAVSDPVSIAYRAVSLTLYVGFCLMGRAPEAGAVALLGAAELSAEEAARNGPRAIRAYSTEICQSADVRSALSSEVTAALENGQVRAYFVPQLCTDTGHVSGMQVVPRWVHESRGVLPEQDLMTALEAAGLRQRFAEVMLYQSFAALRAWEERALNLGAISLPVSAELLSNPKMTERLRWEFDRFDVLPSRIRLILRHSVLPLIGQEVVSRNLRACVALGCQIELSGFGNGQASVSCIRRSNAQRLRIHRSFVANVDKDPEQQRLVAALISLAEGLGLETIAEGVQTIGEHSMLAQLGCQHVQGKAIAAPMPLDETFDWSERHLAKLAATPILQTRRGA
ncbi:GGDEF domain-containing protein [Thioclava sp. A2]|uniref:GGDEF domain-containing protein n=1 Tax=Thioclava sp. FCG-A2 TaxID=3080562 RepID=UPI0029556547|nr:GGDEF domain-containing protein [Thioclava sp. A2]MDV7271959.1 GGDEF domain-containing protein [Thioclava sp. A2]